MKKILILSLIALSITSCSKDSFGEELTNPNAPKKSEIMVRVSYLQWSDDECELGCGSGSSQEVTFISDASIVLYEGRDVVSTEATNPLIQTTTDRDGASLLEDLEPATYTVWVKTPFGQKSRSLSTQLNKRSFIDFSF